MQEIKAEKVWEYYKDKVSRMNLDRVMQMNPDSIKLFTKLKLNDINIRLDGLALTEEEKERLREKNIVTQDFLDDKNYDISEAQNVLNKTIG